jgi:virginiamycin B lyase
MFRPDHRIANLSPGVPLVTPDRVSAAEKEMIIKYLTEHYGPGSSAKPRDLKLDALVRDEQALSEVMYVQYDVPPATGPAFTNTGDPRAGLHDVHVSPTQPGVIWITGNQSGSIVRVDTRNPDYNARTTRWRIPHPNNINVVPHGLIEENGRVLWTELAGDRIGELDPKTGSIMAYRLPTEGAGAHTLRADSKGNVWYTNYGASGKIGRLNLATKQVKEYEPVKSFSGYGLAVDRKDRVWAVGLNTPAVLGYDPKTDKWTTYKISNPARRPAVDNKGLVWAAQFFGNKIASVDPESGKVTEYELPLKFGNPYELIADSQNNIWVENGAYSSFVKFDQQAKKFTYVPYPEIRATTVKFERDTDDTIWFIMPYGGGQPAGLTAFKPKGNAAR